VPRRERRCAAERHCCECVSSAAKHEGTGPPWRASCLEVSRGGHPAGGSSCTSRARATTIARPAATSPPRSAAASRASAGGAKRARRVTDDANTQDVIDIIDHTIRHEAPRALLTARLSTADARTQRLKCPEKKRTESGNLDHAG
jgi:hypothetical protein